MNSHCTDHCSDCGQHFHSLGAFDDHLVRGKGRRNSHGGMEYLVGHLAGEDAGLECIAGDCSMGHEPEPCKIWRRPLTDEQRARLEALKPDSGDRGLQGGPSQGSVESRTSPQDSEAQIFL